MRWRNPCYLPACAAASRWGRTALSLPAGQSLPEAFLQAGKALYGALTTETWAVRLCHLVPAQQDWALSAPAALPEVELVMWLQGDLLQGDWVTATPPFFRRAIKAFLCLK